MSATPFPSQRSLSGAAIPELTSRTKGPEDVNSLPVEASSFEAAPNPSSLPHPQGPVDANETQLNSAVIVPLDRTSRHVDITTSVPECYKPRRPKPIRYRRRRYRTRSVMEKASAEEDLSVLLSPEAQKMLFGSVQCGQGSSRESALEARAAAMSAAEARVRDEGERVAAREQKVAEHELSMRNEMSSFLDQISVRQHRVEELEAQHARTLLEAQKDAAASSARRAEAGNMARNLAADTAELERVTQALQETRDELKAARMTFNVIQNAIESRRNAIENLAEDRARVDRLEQRLRSVEAQVRRREKSVEEREAQLATRLAQADEYLSEVEPLRAAIHSLRYSVRHLRSHSADDSHSPYADGLVDAMSPAEVSRAANEVVQKWRSEMDAHRSAVDEMKRQTEFIARREEELRQRENDVRQREVAARDAVNRVDDTTREIQRRLDAAAASNLAAASTASDLARREDDLRRKEVSLKESDIGLKERENELCRLQTVLATQERSLKRATTAIANREQMTAIRNEALDERERELDSRERSAATVAAASSARETELQAREGGLRRREEAIGRREARAGESIDNVVGDASVSNLTYPTGREIEKRDAANQQSTNEDARRSGFAPNTAATHSGDVWRHDGGVRGAASRHGVSTNANVLNRETGPIERDGANLESDLDRSGCEGEAANNTPAQKVVDEFVTSRTHWTDYVSRLVGVVDSMRPSARSRNIEPLLVHVKNELAAIALAASRDDLPDTHATMEVFDVERAKQLDWGVRLRNQLQTIREVQAGLLMAANRADENSRESLGVKRGIPNDLSGLEREHSPYRARASGAVSASDSDRFAELPRSKYTEHSEQTDASLTGTTNIIAETPEPSVGDDAGSGTSGGEDDQSEAAFERNRQATMVGELASMQEQIDDDLSTVEALSAHGQDGSGEMTGPGVAKRVEAALRDFDSEVRNVSRSRSWEYGRRRSPSETADLIDSASAREDPILRELTSIRNEIERIDIALT